MARIKTIEQEEQPLVNCLRKERVIARHIPRENSMIGNNPKHVLYGGMGENSTRTYVVPQLRSGQLVDVLTKDEKEFLENVLGLDDGALSVYKVENNYWKSFKVTLGKADNYLDLSNPIDYIKYKVLLANSNAIAPNLNALQERPKSTYEYVLIVEGEESKAAKRKIGSTMEAYKEFGKIEDDAATLRVIVETITGRPVASTTSTDALAEKVGDYIQSNAKMFLDIVKDPMLQTKVLVRDAIEAGVIVNRAGQLYLREGNMPLCETGEATLSVACRYLNLPKNADLKFSIEAKVTQYKENSK